MLLLFRDEGHISLPNLWESCGSLFLKIKKKMIWWASHKKCLKTKIINVVLHYLVDLSEPKKNLKIKTPEIY